MVKFRTNNAKNKVEAFSSAANAASLLGAESDSSRVAEGAYIHGKLEFSGIMYFAGRLEGSIQAGEGYLELSKNGAINGDIHCQILDCCGQVNGSIQAHSKSILRSDCKLIGDIVTKELLIQNGAQISGHCKMLENKIDMDLFSMPIENLRQHLKLEKLAK